MSGASLVDVSESSALFEQGETTELEEMHLPVISVSYDELSARSLERLAEIIQQTSHRASLLPSHLLSRRDLHALRNWKGMVGRKQCYLITQLLSYPIFAHYAHFLLGISHKGFLEYLRLPPLSAEEVDEVARWQNFQVFVVNSSYVTEDDASFVGYQIVCETKLDQTMQPNNLSEGQSRSWVVCKRYSEFHTLRMTLRKICKPLQSLPFPGRTLLSVGKNDSIVTERVHSLDIWLRGVIRWIHEESPWSKGETVTREWIQCTEALDQFLFVSTMAIDYPKKSSNPTTDRDYGLHESVRTENWFDGLMKGTEKHLYLSQTRISLQALSYTTNDNIETADLIGMSSDLREFTAFLNSFVGSSSLKRLFLNDVHVGDIQEPMKVLEELMSHPRCRLEDLFLTGWQLKGTLQTFAACLSRCKLLDVLDLSRCNIDDIQTGMVDLCAGLRHSNIRELYLDENSFGDDGARLISLALQHNPNVELLSMKYCKITPQGTIFLLDAINPLLSNEPVNSNLLHLYIQDMSMEDGGDGMIRNLALQCAAMLENNSYLKELDLSGHYFDTDSGLIIMRALQHNTSLRKMILSHPKQNWQSSRILHEFFKSNQSVTSLHLTNHMTPIADMSGESLDYIEYLIPNDELLTDLFTWNMDAPFFTLFCAGLSNNSSLVLLDLHAVQFSEEHLHALTEMVKKNGKLEELLLRATKEHQYSDLFQAICGSHISSISCSNVTESQGSEFLCSLKENPNHHIKAASFTFQGGNVNFPFWDALPKLLAKA